MRKSVIFQYNISAGRFLITIICATRKGMISYYRLWEDKKRAMASTSEESNHHGRDGKQERPPISPTWYSQNSFVKSIQNSFLSFGIRMI